MHRLMVVDDDPNVLSALRRSLARPGDTRHGEYQVELFEAPQRALEQLKSRPFDLILSDYRMPGMDGVKFLTTAREVQPDAIRLILSGYADLNGLVAAINEAQIFRFLAKPWHEYDLLSAVSQALEYRRLLTENQELADLVRIERGKLSRHEAELRRLERETPGITRVNWGEDGSVIFEDLTEGDTEDLQRMFGKQGK
jgi:two-component system probable response regulator PhcQ